MANLSKEAGVDLEKGGYDPLYQLNKNRIKAIDVAATLFLFLKDIWSMVSFRRNSLIRNPIT